MAILAEAAGFLQFAAGVRAFLRETVTPEAAAALVQKRLATREADFVRFVERAVFDNPRSPYAALFHQAGCELEDFKRLVQSEGLEGALECLVRSGIYVTYDEFKGRRPATRGSQTFNFRDVDFDNPLAPSHFQGSSGGSSGRPARIRMNLDHLAQTAPHWALWFANHGWAHHDVLFWTQQFAGVANRQLIAAKIGHRPVRWFSLGAGLSARDRLTSRLIHGTLRSLAGFPRPEFVPVGQARQVGDALAALVQAGRRPCLFTSPSAAIRICRAMEYARQRLEGATFILGAEPITPTRRAAVEEAGARVVPTFGFSEGGTLGLQCPNPTAADDVHILRDAFAVITRARAVYDEEHVVDALLLTSLRPACPKIMLNAEIGDYAVLESRNCGCLFDEFGYHQHLHTIRSFDKLTGEGVTFAGVDLYRLLEEILPKRFGGVVGDYQLIEQHTEGGLARYLLLVSPTVGALDEAEVTRAFLDGLSRMKGSYRLMAGLWQQTGLLQLKREHPIATARGKVLPFRMVGP